MVLIIERIGGVSFVDPGRGIGRSGAGRNPGTEELYEKDLHDLDNHDGVIIHLEPDILECEVKWALELRTKLVEVMEFQLSYSKS